MFKYVSLFLGVVLSILVVVGYFYYSSTQTQIANLSADNSKLETAIELSEETNKKLIEDFEMQSILIENLNNELSIIRQRNTEAIRKIEEAELGKLAIEKTELLEQLINNASDAASRCFEIISGATLNERELNAKNGREFNSECPWLYDDLGIGSMR